MFICVYFMMVCSFQYNTMHCKCVFSFIKCAEIGKNVFVLDICLYAPREVAIFRVITLHIISFKIAIFCGVSYIQYSSGIMGSSSSQSLLITLQ